MTRIALLVLLCLPLGVVAGGCEGRKPEPSGIGKWRFTKSVRGDAKDGVCQPTELTDGRKATWCFAMPPYKIAGRNADVDLYFDGADDQARLIEIQLKVRGCVEDDLDRWMRATFGLPIETKATRSYWQNSFMWVAAMMPSEPGRCIVHLLPLSEAAEIARIKQR